MSGTTRQKETTMVIYVLIGLACSSILCLVSFLIGRCARLMPVIDNRLPWIMIRSMTSSAVDDIRDWQPARPGKLTRYEWPLYQTKRPNSPGEPALDEVEP
jgi:hypothetical protein